MLPLVLVAIHPISRIKRLLDAAARNLPSQDSGSLAMQEAQRKAGEGIAVALPPAVPPAEHQLRSRTEQVRRLEGELEGRGVLMKELQRRLHRVEAEAREAQRKVTNDRNFVGVLNFLSATGAVHSRDLALSRCRGPACLAQSVSQTSTLPQISPVGVCECTGRAC